MDTVERGALNPRGCLAGPPFVMNSWSRLEFFLRALLSSISYLTT